jgi:hypothetical protein
MSSIADDQGPSIPKLPLWRTICSAYSIYFDDFLDVLRASWLCIAVAVPLLMIEQSIQLSRGLKAIADLRGAVATHTPIPPPSAPIGMMLPVYAASLLVLLAGVSIAVAWHRQIILGERPRLSGSNVATISFWRYIAVGIGITLTALLPFLLLLVLVAFLAMLFSAALGGPDPARFPIWVFPLAFLLFLAGLAIVLRLILLLPARAAGNWSPTFKDSWNRTRGNAWRLFWGLAACTVPPGLLIQIVSLIVLASIGGRATVNAAFATGSAESFVTWFAAVGAILWAFYLLTTPIAVGFLSLSYLHFFEPSRAIGSVRGSP